MDIFNHPLFWYLMTSAILLAPVFRAMLYLSPLPRFRPPRIEASDVDLRVLYKTSERGLQLKVINISRSGIMLEASPEEVQYLLKANQDLLRLQIVNFVAPHTEIKLYASVVGANRATSETQVAMTFAKKLSNSDLFYLLHQFKVQPSSNWVDQAKAA